MVILVTSFVVFLLEFNNDIIIAFGSFSCNIKDHQFYTYTYPITFTKLVHNFVTGSDVLNVTVSGWLIQTVTMTNCRVGFWSGVTTGEFRYGWMLSVGY